jgi:uncharacterized protein (DUF58 family)
MAAAPLIDRAFLEKLERLTIHWSKSFPGLVGGHNPSRFAGAGQEFLDHRHFHHGDDLRAVNWRAYMRLEKMFLKMFQIEPRVPVRLLLDISGSMTTGDGPGGAKFDFARKLSAALCYVGLVRLDTVLIQPFTDRLHDPHTSGGGRHRLSPVVDYLTALNPGGPTDLMAVCRSFISEYPQRGLVIAISDFLEDRDVERPLQFLADFGHELSLIQVWSEEDRSPPWDGELDLEDAETGGHLQISFDSQAREQYTRMFDEHSASLQKVALRNSGRYVGLSTSLPVEDAVFGPMIRSRGVA